MTSLPIYGDITTYLSISYVVSGHLKPSKSLEDISVKTARNTQLVSPAFASEGKDID
jgi:hypothetical protein